MNKNNNYYYFHHYQVFKITAVLYGTDF